MAELRGAVGCATPEAVAREAADVANFAMMIADNAGGLPDAPPARTIADEQAALDKLHKEFQEWGVGETVADFITWAKARLCVTFL